MHLRHVEALGAQPQHEASQEDDTSHECVLCKSIRMRQETQRTEKTKWHNTNTKEKRSGLKEVESATRFQNATKSQP
eukprot:6469678-Amphidinium_carterae.1